MTDIVFLHMPKKVGAYREIMKMPLGLTALADLLEKNGFSARIFHESIEQKADPGFDPVKLARKEKAKLVALTLHWHPQSYRVIETARSIKVADPDRAVVLGGLTASLFADEIVSTFKEIDYVVRGDAEIPLLELARGDKPKKDIPNLTWRDGERTVSNPLSYSAGREMLDSLVYSRLDLIAHHEMYLRLFDHEQDLDLMTREKLMASRPFAYYNAGRGCPVNCSFCGGSNSTQCATSKRDKYLFISIPSVIRDLKGFAAHGAEYLYTSFDPDPRNDHYLKLFEQVRREGIKLNCYFECWDLPTDRFINDFGKTFGEGSCLIFSPDAGSEKVRRLNKGFSYSNAELMAKLDRVKKNGIKAEAYFTLGLPFETGDDLKETEDLMAELKRNHGDTRVRFMPMELDPGSPIWFDEKKYGATSFRKNFKDLYEAHRKAPSLGYRTDAFSEEEIINKYREMSDRLKKV
ncbi:MAG TPA: radical SAM protein [Candidatus Omnitrophota bacterium]|nr:radical SAM protein [Candidatus Omnitrophota bacterium]